MSSEVNVAQPCDRCGKKVKLFRYWVDTLYNRRMRACEKCSRKMRVTSGYREA